MRWIGWLAAAVLLLGGLVVAFYHNPYGWDGHSELTCGGAFSFPAAYSGELNPACPGRLWEMRFGSVALIVAGASIAWVTRILGNRGAPPAGRL
ncbi:hypothetical protein FDA94_17960 [Herbidospora galbida]|uniref:Uncharacterized protein n=1 Tax=Herbidospora galbida TaxID=2575442 RepID=A0A4U3MGE5_9ACTN|nr:hypothetical protein [Herbidospora galbida]TKK87384.1 hypothetical protein FDA94_17960 [Herbidospora galbida]